MNDIQEVGTEAFEPVHTQAHQSKHWLTVSDAVLHCSSRGLSRTPKTIRKWAARSHGLPENADISVRREDTDNGFRWSIELGSLDRKIDQELVFEARNHSEPPSTEPDMSEPVLTENSLSLQSEPSSDPSEPVRTKAERFTPSSVIERELRAQLQAKIEEVEFLREELTHRRKTDQALGSVIEAFRLNSETNQAKTLGHDRPTNQQPEWGRERRHDVVQNNTTDQRDLV